MNETGFFENDEEFVLKSGAIPAVAISKKYDGVFLVLFASPEKISIFTDEGRWVEDSLPDLVAEIKKTKQPAENYCILGELESWEDGIHQPRETTAALLHKKEVVPGKGITFNVFDVLFVDGDTHNFTKAERRKILETFSFPQCTMGVPRDDVILNLAPELFCETLKEADDALTKCLKAPGSEGSVILLADTKDSAYSLSGITPALFKQKKQASVHALIGGVNETKTKGVFNYELFLRFRSSDQVDSRTVKEIGGQKYTFIGKSYNSKIKMEVGSIATVGWHAMNLYETEVDGETVYKLSLYEPTIIERWVEQAAPDYFSTALKIGEDSGLLIEKLLTKAMDLLWRVPPELMKNFMPEYRRSNSHDQGVLKMESVPEELRKGRFVWFVTDEDGEDFDRTDRELEVEKMQKSKEGRKMGILWKE